MRSLVSWSGGKDSCYAMLQAIEQGYQPQVLLNVLNEAGQISRSHGIPAEVLEQQAKLFKIPIHLVAASWQDYESVFTGALQHLKKTYHLTHALFGDIDLQAHRSWEETVCRNAGLQAHLPLWGQNRKQLVLEMLEAGIQTSIVSCNEIMGPSFIGRNLTPELVAELEVIGIDPCGEGGEFHTLVTNCPLFENPMPVQFGTPVNYNGYWFAPLTLPQA